MGREYYLPLVGKTGLAGMGGRYTECVQCGKSLPADAPHSPLLQEDDLRWMNAREEWWEVYEALESDTIGIGGIPNIRP